MANLSTFYAPVPGGLYGLQCVMTLGAGWCAARSHTCPAGLKVPGAARAIGSLRERACALMRTAFSPPGDASSSLLHLGAAGMAAAADNVRSLGPALTIGAAVTAICRGFAVATWMGSFLGSGFCGFHGF